MIHFKLADLDCQETVEEKTDLYLSWFWLTEGDLWLTFGSETIYEYSKEAIQYFDNKPSPYNDYYIVRFLEDFTELFEKINESIPDRFYAMTAELDQFYKDSFKWLGMYDRDENEYSDFYFEEYNDLISWVTDRTMKSSHLIGGPSISFFRNDDKIRIVWETEHFLDNGICLWTTKDGSYEMNFSDFIRDVKLFGINFFNAMEHKIELILANEYWDIKSGKTTIMDEHRERLLDFEKKLALLEQSAINKTNWMKIEGLYNRMNSEIK